MPTTRRDFLRTAAASAAAVAATSIPAFAAKPIPRPAGSAMKLSLAAYSFNRMLKKAPTPDELADAEMTLDEFVDFCAELGIEGTELTGYYFPKYPPALDAMLIDEIARDSEPVRRRLSPPFPGVWLAAAEVASLQGLKNRCFRLGLDISGTAIGNDFCHPEGEERTRQIADCKQWIDRAAILGAPVIRIFAGKTKKGQDEAAALDLCVAGINECLKHAALRGVCLALENHGGITATPDQMLAIIERVDDSPWFGVNFDSGNFRTDDPYRDLARIAPYALNAQIKVAIHPAGKEKQPADLDRIIGILKDAHYRGYVVLEYEEPDAPREHIPRYLDKLRKLIA